MTRWTSIEVFDGPFSAQKWMDTYGDVLSETALLAGARDWAITRTAWGVVFEVEFKTDAEWDHYKNLPVVMDALKYAPNPGSGVLIYRGRSLDGGSPAPRKPKPFTGSGSNALALPLSFDSIPFPDVLPPLFGDSNVDQGRIVRR